MKSYNLEVFFASKKGLGCLSMQAGVDSVIISEIEFEKRYFTIVTGALALWEINVEVLPKKISFGKPSPREPTTI